MKRFILLILFPVIITGCTLIPKKASQQNISDGKANILTDLNVNNIEGKITDSDKLLEVDINNSTPEEVFAEAMTAAKNVDVDKYFSYIYSSESFLKSAKETAALYPEIKELSLENMFLSQFNGLEYTIDNVDIKNDVAVLKVMAIKNNRQKKPQYIYLIKDNGVWKINGYGWMHPADGTAKSLDGCREICESSPMFVKSTNECFCFKEKPSAVDLSYLQVEKCENEAAPFKSTCYIAHAKTTLNEEYCKKVSLMNINECFSTLARIKGDDTICDYLLDDRQCLEGVINSNK